MQTGCWYRRLESTLNGNGSAGGSPSVTPETPGATNYSITTLNNSSSGLSSGTVSRSNAIAFQDFQKLLVNTASMACQDGLSGNDTSCTQQVRG